MSRNVSFEWKIDARPDGYYVVEHLCGTDKTKEFGPLKPQTAEAVIRARRAFVHRMMYERGGVRLLLH